MATTTKDDPINDKPMPLLDHLIELRRRLMWSMGALIIAFVICYYFSGGIYHFLAKPLERCAGGAGGGNHALIYTQLYEAFFTYIRVAFFGAAFLSFPVIADAVVAVHRARPVSQREARDRCRFWRRRRFCSWRVRRWRIISYFPFAWRFFLSFQMPAGAGGIPIELMAKVSDYLDLVMKLIFAFGLAFELPVALTLLGEGRHHHLERAEEVSALCLCRHVHRRRGADAAGHHHAVRLGPAADRALRNFDLLRDTWSNRSRSRSEMHDIHAIRADPAAFDAAMARRGLPPVADDLVARTPRAAAA